MIKIFGKGVSRSMRRGGLKIYKMVAASEKKNYVEHLNVMLYRRQPREMSDKRHLILKQECGWVKRLP